MGKKVVEKLGFRSWAELRIFEDTPPKLGFLKIFFFSYGFLMNFFGFVTKKKWEKRLSKRWDFAHGRSYGFLKIPPPRLGFLKIFFCQYFFKFVRNLCFIFYESIL